MSLLKEFKLLLQENDLKGDPWGVSMGAFFEVSAHLYEKGDCPAHWQYKVGWGGNHIEMDTPFYDLLMGATAEQLEEIGEFLYKLTEVLKRKGRDY